MTDQIRKALEDLEALTLPTSSTVATATYKVARKANTSVATKVVAVVLACCIVISCAITGTLHYKAAKAETKASSIVTGADEEASEIVAEAEAEAAEKIAQAKAEAKKIKE